MERLKLALAACLIATALVPRDASAYSVLAHEANIDALWTARSCR